jgi:hypothetical protein
VKIVVTTVGLLVVLAWAFHELAFLHDVSAERDSRGLLS